MKTINAVLVILVLVAVSSSPAFALWNRGDKPLGYARDKPGGSEPGKLVERIARRLNLTAEQKEKFTAQSKKLQKDIAANRDKIKDFSAKLRAEMQKDTPDKNIIHRLIRDLDQTRTEMQIVRIDSLLDLRKILTPEQKEKFKKLLEKGPPGERGRPRPK